MDVIFCDLCNESVPLNDLQEGRAVRRGARVVCAACEKSMSGALHPVMAMPAAAASAGLGPAGSQAAAAEAPGRGTSATTARGSSSGVWVGLLVLGVGALALHRVDQRMQAVENQQGMQREDLAKARAGAQLAREEAQLLRTANTELAGRLSSSEQNTATVRTELEKLVAADRARNEEQLARQVENSDALRRSLEAQLLERERRIEELGMRLAKSEDAQLALQQRLDELAADALAQREAPPAVGQPQPQVAAWHALLPRLQDENPSVRWQAVDELSRVGDPAVLDSVVGCLQDKDLFVRMRAAGALGELKLEAAVPALLDALADSEPMVREAACQSLKLVTGRDPRFDPLASDAEREKRLRALREAYPAPRAAPGAPGAAPANPQGS